MTIASVNLKNGHPNPGYPNQPQGVEGGEEVPILALMGPIFQTPKQTSPWMHQNLDPLVLPSDAKEDKKHMHRRDAPPQQMT